MNTKRKKKQIWKLPKHVFYIFCLCIFLLYIKLAYLSLSPTVYGKNLSAFASTRNTVHKTIQASRGNIYDVNGNALAINVSSYTLIAYLDESRSEGSSVLKHVKNVEETATKLAEVLDGDKDQIQTILEKGIKSNKYQVEIGSIGKGITELKKEEIEALNLPGISFIESQKRYYPNGKFASYVLGYAKETEVETDEGTTTEIVGELGIEAQYDDLLKGEDGYLEYQQDRYGYKISGTKEINNEAKNGYDVYLTLDSSIERFVETEIEEIQSTYDPEWTVLTVMDAKTGDILGASSTPSFDPNVRDVQSYENPFSTTAYEPGSTMKIYTYMCAIETGEYDGNFEFSSGHITIGEDTVNDWNNTGWGKITLDKGFEYSSNVGVVNLIRQYLSKEKLKECLKKYGFGQKTGIEFTRESAGQINFNYEIEVATAGFGQGIKTTVVQMLQAATIIANDGYMIKPHIVSKIVNSNTNEVYYESTVSKSEQLVKKSTVEKVKELMYNTIHGTDSGTAGKAYNIEGFDLIGKTGTAQIYESGKGYLTGDNNYIFSAIIMYPKDDPEIIIYGAMKKPSYGKYTGLSTAVKNLVKNIAKYKNIYEEETSASEVSTLTLNSYQGMKVEEVKKSLKNYNLDVIVLGEGDQVVNQYPSAGVTTLENDKVILLTNDTNYKMPSIKGWSKSDVNVLANLLNFKVESEGYGYVTETNIEEGTSIEENMTLKVKFSSKMED
jgi:penicillin-binding protein 2B